MEDFITTLQNEVKNDPLTTLNIVMAIFTVVSFSRLCSDICRTFSCKKNKGDKINATLELVEKQDARVSALELELSQQRIILERMDNYITNIHYSICVGQEQSQSQSQSETQSQDQQSQTEETQEDEMESLPSRQSLLVNEIEPVPESKRSNDVKDKHAQLIAALKDGDAVQMTYKKQTFAATFVIKKEAQHGYVLKCGDVEYNTPSHFSHAKKVAINDKIKSDNGWDTVVVIRDGKKVSLNDLISA